MRAGISHYTVKQVFDVLGAEEILMKTYHSGTENEVLYHRKDFFDPDGKMRDFRNYTLGRLQDEFWACVYIG